MNFIKKPLVERKIRGGIGALGRVGASPLPILDFSTWPWPLANLSYFPVGLAEKLTWKLQQIWDLRAITKDGNLNVILPNKLADRLDMKLLEL